MRTIISKQIIKNYIISFALIICIPITIIMISLYSIGYAIFSNELSKKEISTQNIFMTSLEHELMQCDAIANQLLEDINFSQLSLQKSPASGVNLIHSLADHTLLNPFIADIVVAFPGSDYFYSSSSSMSKDFFYDTFRSPLYSPTQLNYLLTQTDSPTFITNLSYNNNEYLGLITPLSYYGQAKGSALFLLDPLVHSIDSASAFKDAHELYALDTNYLEADLQQLDFSMFPSMTPAYLAEELSVLIGTEGNLSLEVDNHFLYAYSLDPLSNIIMLTTTSLNSIYRSLNLLNTLMFLTILIALLITLLVSYYAFKHNYQPIQELGNNLSSLATRNYALKNKIDSTLPMQQHYLLSQLISGKLNNLDDFYAHCHEANLNLDSPYHSVMIMYSIHLNFTLDTNVLRTIHDLQSATLVTHYVLQHIYPNIHIYIIGTDKPLDIPKLEFPTLTAYFGTSCDSLLSLPSSYVSAYSQLDLFLMNAKHNHSLFDDYKHYYTKLENSLINHDFTATSELLLQVLGQLELNEAPLPVSKSICTEIIMLFYRYFDTHDELNSYERFDLSKLYKLSDYDAIKEVFIEVCSEMLLIITNFNSSLQCPLSIQCIQTHIQEIYTDPTISRESIAYHFRVHPQYLEDFFSKQTNTFLCDYVVAIRIEAAKELLITTSYPLKTVAQQIGFYHISSFISAFEEHVNLTPGQFRTLNSIRKDSEDSTLL